MADRITEVLEQFAEARQKMLDELGKVIVGQRDVVDQIFAAIFNAMMFVVFLVFGLLFFSPWLWLIAPLHAIVAIAMRNDDRRHRELVAAIERHGPPPGYRP